MPHVYRSEIQAGGIVNQGFGALGNTNADITHQSYYFMVSDTNEKYWAIHAELYTTGTEFKTTYEFKWWPGVIAFNSSLGSNATDDPETWFLIFDHDPMFPGGYISITQTAGAGDNGALFLAGGTLAIEKDEAMNEIRFITPLGTRTMPLADATNIQTNFDALDAEPLYFRGHGHHMHIPFGANITKEATVEWHDAQDLTDGTPVFTIAMSTGDPGNWGPDRTASNIGYPESVAVGGCGAGILLCNIGNSQLATRYRMQFTHILADDTPSPRYVCNVWFRYRIIDLSIDTLDAVVDPSTGTLLVTTVWDYPMKRVICLYSNDDGHSFIVSTIDQVTDTVFTYPSITAHPNGLIYVFYLTSATDKLYYAVSRNKGRTWDAPLFLAILNPPLDRPKARFHPTTGVLFLTYFSPMDLNTYLQRIDAIGSTAIDSTAIMVRALAKGPYDIYFDSNGRIMIATRDNTTGGRIVMFSRDGGNSFEDLSLGDFTDNASLAQVTTQSTDLGIGATIYQATDGTFYSYVTDDNGQSRLLAESIILTGLGPQEFGHVHGPNHQFYFIFLVGSSPFQLVLCWISRDFVNFWAPA
jgi:hypothetical protein